MPPSKTAGPDTSPAELAQLAARYPAQALANPVLPLLLLENPAWFEELPEKTLLALLGALADGPTAAPPALLAAATPHKSAAVRAAVAANPAAPAEVLATLATDASEAVLQGLAANPATPPAVLATLAAAPEKETRARAAANPATPPATLAALATDPAPAVAQAALRNPLLPPELLAQRAATGDWHACALVALHPHCPPALLTHLARDQRNTTQYPVAAHPATPPEAMALLHAREQAQPDRTLHRCLVLRQGHTPATAAQLLHHTAATDRALCLLLQLGHPALLSADNRATLAASPVAADRLSVAHLPEFQAQLRDDPHLLVRLVARGDASAAS